MNIELRLSVEDSPNSAGVAIDMVRCAKLALERKQGGVLDGPAAYFCKHPPRQYTDDQAHQMTEAFIAGAPISVSVEREARPATETAERKRLIV
jgi:myo-inositol-1-phosphate synthase